MLNYSAVSLNWRSDDRWGLKDIADTDAELVERIIAESVLVGYKRTEVLAFEHKVSLDDHRLVAVVNPA